MIQIVNYSVRSGGKRYLKGEVLKGLSPNEEKRLVKLGYAKIVETVDAKAKIKDELNLRNITVEEAKSLIEDIRDVDKLYSILEQEAAGKDRSSLIEFIEDQIEEVAGEANEL
ncbi:hypothetical protein QBE53_06080 [Vallitaleaceae bacterium 9-2]